MDTNECGSCRCMAFPPSRFCFLSEIVTEKSCGKFVSNDMSSNEEKTMGSARREGAKQGRNECLDGGFEYECEAFFLL